MVKRILSVVLLTSMVLGIAWIGKKVTGQEQTAQKEAGSNPYFYDLDGGCEDHGIILLEAFMDYSNTEVRTHWRHGTCFGIERLEMEYDRGTLYAFYLPFGHNELFFYVTPDKIYRVRTREGQENIWKKEEELIENSDIVCQTEEMETIPQEGAAGTYINIQREGNLVTCSRREMGADGNTGFHETFVWKEGGGLVEYRSGYGEETEDFGLERIELSSICLFGTWHMDEIAVISRMYTGTTLDGYREEDLYDSADYIGFELEYTPQMMRLGDEKYENPAYLIMYSTIDGIDRGGGRFVPDLYEYLIEKNIEVKRTADADLTRSTELIVFYVEFMEKVSYGKYPFIPVGAQCILLNDDTMIVEVWGKTLLAHRVE